VNSSLFEGRCAYAADRIFDGQQVLADSAVIVDGGTISDLVPAADLPADMPVVDFAGRTIIPGLIDAHMHFIRWQGPFYLACTARLNRMASGELAKWRS
jgi:imidazolonepropionase-like amidohydrolase